jgi:hypothetical protein
MHLHKDHRLIPLASGRVHCFLCDAVAWLDELKTCTAPQSERDEFDARYTPAAACEPVAHCILCGGTPCHCDRERD